LDGCRVLVVEGHDDTLEMNRMALSILGADVRSACSGEAALAVLGDPEWVPNALLTDMSLPGMSAFELADRVAAPAGGAKRDVPVVATSADARPRARLEGLGRGFRAVLFKPYDPAELCAAVAGALGREDRRAQRREESRS
jgi:CheY-like chemotaxis protein